MSKIDCYQCDTCKKTSFDFMADKWIQIEGCFAEYDGRNEDGIAITKRFIPSSESSYHFCSWECFKAYKS